MKYVFSGDSKLIVLAIDGDSRLKTWVSLFSFDVLQSEPRCLTDKSDNLKNNGWTIKGFKIL